jgi:thymidine kinase
MVARIDLILGCMFAGKSSELLRRVRCLQFIQKRILVVNHELDRGRQMHLETQGIRTHTEQVEPGIFVARLMELVDRTDFQDAQVVAVDEVQFFPDLREFVLHVEHMNKHIILAGLDGDKDRRPFGQCLDIIPLCDTVLKLHAYDMVRNDESLASFSMQLPQQAIDGNTQIQVGGSDRYAAVSRETYLRMYTSNHATAATTQHELQDSTTTTAQYTP